MRQKRKKGNSTRALLGLEGFTNYGIQTAGGELAVFLVQPTNISVLSHANVEIKIRHLLMVFSAHPGLEISCLDSCQRFDDNKRFSVFSENMYKQACEKAVYIVDEEKVAFLQEQASAHTDKLSPDFFGKLAQYAYTWPGVQFISAQIIERCSPEEVSATPEGLLKVALLGGDMELPRIMARKRGELQYAKLHCKRSLGLWQSWPGALRKVKRMSSLLPRSTLCSVLPLTRRTSLQS